MAIFTIAVLLAGTIGYATSIYMLPSAAADDDGPEFDTDCVLDCAEDFEDDVRECAEDFDDVSDPRDSDVEDLEECLEQAREKFDNCMEESEIDDGVAVCQD